MKRALAALILACLPPLALATLPHLGAQGDPVTVLLPVGADALVVCDGGVLAVALGTQAQTLADALGA